MAHRWHVSHGRDGETLHVYDYDAHALVAEFVEVAWDRACGWTGGRLGGHGLGEWAWRVPVGLPKYDREDCDEQGRPWLENSLASRLNDVEQAVCLWAYRRTETCLVSKLPITSEQARVLAPGLLEIFDDDDAAA